MRSIVSTVASFALRLQAATSAAVDAPLQVAQPRLDRTQGQGMRSGAAHPDHP